MSKSPNPEIDAGVGQAWCFEPIARVESPFQEKFGIPRQSGLAPSARGRVYFLPPYDQAEALDGLEQVSHVWLLWVFHEIPRDHWQPRVRPPRLGGNKSLGVFATRSMFRPNPIGLSLVRLESISRAPNALSLEVSGLDLLDGTPVLDIKPYLPYSDRLADASHGLAREAPRPGLQLSFAEEALKTLSTMVPSEADMLQNLVRESLCLDPRPAYRHGQQDPRCYGTRLMGREVRWSMTGPKSLTVFEIGEHE